MQLLDSYVNRLVDHDQEWIPFEQLKMHLEQPVDVRVWYPNGRGWNNQ